MIRKTRSKRDAGRFGEEMASLFLTKNGYNILCRNYTCAGGEIDIIATKGEHLCFVEVKLRKCSCGENSGVNAVDAAKISHITTAIDTFLSEYSDNIYICSLTPRIDIIEIYTRTNSPQKYNHITGITL